MKRIVLSFALLISAIHWTTAFSFAQTSSNRDGWEDAGGGGEAIVWVARNSEGKRQRYVYMVDFNEAFNKPIFGDGSDLFSFLIFGRNHVSVDRPVRDHVEAALERIKRLDPDLHNFLGQTPMLLAAEIEDAMLGTKYTKTKLIYFRDDPYFYNPHDSRLNVVLPNRSAKIRTVAVQTPKRFGKPLYIEMVRRYVRAMEFEQAALLVMHEVLYTYAWVKLNHNYSDATRSLNAYLFSGRSATDTPDQYKRFLAQVDYQFHEPLVPANH